MVSVGDNDGDNDGDNGGSNDGIWQYGGSPWVSQGTELLRFMSNSSTFGQMSGLVFAPL